MSRKLLIAFLASVAAGCSTDSQRGFDIYYANSPHASGTPTANAGLKTGSEADLERLVRSVAASRATQENTTGLVRVRGIYTGREGDCDGVAVQYLDPGQSQSPDNYFVCGAMIRRDRKLNPSYPDSPDARGALDDARRAALLYGEQRVAFQAYAIHTRRLGVDSGRPCRPVETTISYQGRLAYHDVREVCQ